MIVASIKAQDLIVLTNGEKIEAKVTEVSETEVRYKKWSNLLGPTWVKNITEIERIKYQKDRLLKRPTFVQGEKWDFRACGSSSKPKSKKSRCVTGNEIVAQIDIFYANKSWDRLQSYIANLPSCVSRECILQYYYECYLKGCDDENGDDIIKYGTTYMKAGGTDELPTVLPTVAKVHAIHNNESEVENLINEFKQYSKANDDLFDDDIEQLKRETYELLHPYRIEDEILGAWVNITKNYKVVPYSACNPMVLFIDNAIDSIHGARLILPGQSIDLIDINKKQKILLNKPINISQVCSCNGPAKLMALQFASEDIKDRTWLSDLASTLTEGTRQMNANMSATIWSSNASFTDKFTTDLGISLGLTAIGSLLSNISYSSRTVEDYKILLTPVSDNILSSRISHVSTTIDNDSHVYNNSNTLNEENTFIRWEDCDSIMFVSGNGKPITLNPVSKDDPLLEEYYAIKKETSFWRPQYSIPFFVGNGAGVCLMAFGYRSITRQDNLGKILGLIMSGTVTMIVSSIVTPLISSEKRQKLYQKLNDRNLEKLKKKYNAEISFAPIYNTKTNMVGASVNLKF